MMGSLAVSVSMFPQEFQMTTTYASDMRSSGA
jgi:hypothetical protein